MLPPAAEVRLGLSTYGTSTPGIGGKLRTEVEDFQVIELGDGPRRRDGKFTAARIRLRNWETNRFVGIAANRIGLRAGDVAFGGMKDKRAVTEQWFTFRCGGERLKRLDLEDVEILATHATDERAFTGSHAGNRFVLRVREHHGTPEIVAATAAAITATGGVPGCFGPQRFGGSFRPITHLVGEALVNGDLEEAVRLYVGHPVPGENHEAYEARKVYEETRNPEAALALYPHGLDPERRILERLMARPGDWRHALLALPHNLLQLFVHAHQSLLFNHMVSLRIARGLSLAKAEIGDRVMPVGDDGTSSHLVNPRNQNRVQRELDAGRAVITAALVGLDAPLAEGEMGEIEAEVLAKFDVDLTAFRMYEMPQLASGGRRRAILQRVNDLEVAWVEGDPVVSFSLGKGDYATTVMREFMKVEV